MIDFRLTERDAFLIGLAHDQALIARRYARRYDDPAGDLVPDALPEAQNAPNVRALSKDRPDETSGAALIDVLLLIEETWGTVPFRKNSNEGMFLGGKLVDVLGDDAQRSRWGHAAIAIALTEPEAGSDPSRIRTTATYDAATERWTLNGEKIFISLAQTCDAVLVFSRIVEDDRVGMGIFVVDKGTFGLTIGAQHDKMGQRGWDTAGVYLDACTIPAANRLPGAMKQTLAVFNRSRPYVSAIGLGFSRAALDLTREVLTQAGYDLSYRQGDGQLSAHVARFFVLEAAFEAAYLTLLHAKWVEDTTGADKIEASRTKVSAARAARRIIDGCLNILGPEAASERHLLEMWLRDARVCDIYEGPGEVNRLILAREILHYTPLELN